MYFTISWRTVGMLWIWPGLDFPLGWRRSQGKQQSLSSPLETKSVSDLPHNPPGKAGNVTWVLSYWSHWTVTLWPELLEKEAPLVLWKWCPRVSLPSCSRSHGMIGCTVLSITSRVCLHSDVRFILSCATSRADQWSTISPYVVSVSPSLES